MKRYRIVALILIFILLATLGTPALAAPGGKKGPAGKGPCPAAPAVAASLLKETGTGHRLNSGNLISLVAREMGPGTDFQGIPKTDRTAYRAAIREFLDDLLEGKLPSDPSDSCLIRYTDRKDGTGLLELWVRDTDGSNITGLRASDFQVEPSRGSSFTLADSRFSFRQLGSGRYEAIFDPGNNPVHGYWDIRLSSRTLIRDLKVTTSFTYERSGTFTSIRDLPGLWEFTLNLTESADMDLDPVWSGTVRLEGPGDETITGTVYDLARDYDYWDEDNLALTGSALRGSNEYHFLLLMAAGRFWFALSDEDPEDLWEDGSVWSTEDRLLDLHSKTGDGPFNPLL